MLDSTPSEAERLFCESLNYYTGGTNNLCGVYKPLDIVKHVADTRCCDLVLAGHAGSNVGNTGGIVSHVCENCGLPFCPGCTRRRHCRILPDQRLERQLGASFRRRCKSCRIVIASCRSAEFAGPIVNIAKNTGCVVCGPIDDVPFEWVPSPDAIKVMPNVRCVDSAGRQISGPPFSLPQRGHPPADGGRPVLCRDLVRTSM
jgi:hypothetical protein